MKQALRVAAIFAMFFCMSAGAAKADGSGSIQYTITGPASDPISVSFVIAANPIVDPFMTDNGIGFTVNVEDMVVNGVPISDDAVTFYDLSMFGGLSDQLDLFNLANPDSAPFQLLFTGSDGNPVLLSLDGGVDLTGWENGFDGYTLTATPMNAPEPASVALLGLGLASVLFIRRTRTAE